MNMMSAPTPKCLVENYCIIYSTEIGKLDMPHAQIRNWDIFHHLGASLVTQMVKYLPECRRPGFNTWFWKVPWRRAWQPIPVFLPGESPWTESLAGYGPRSRKELDTTEQLCTSILISLHLCNKCHSESCLLIYIILCCFLYKTSSLKFQSHI